MATHTSLVELLQLPMAQFKDIYVVTCELLEERRQG